MRLIHMLRVTALALVISASPPANAVTLWTGPNTNFIQFLPSPYDQITPGVALDRGDNLPLYNSVTETGPNGVTSPDDTLWAFGSISNYSTLSYQTFASFRNGDLAAVILDQPMVLQLINEQIYISIEFTAWGQQGVGGFAYTRSTAPASLAPTVTITNPVGGAVFAAPANINLSANASVSGGTVTNVSFFGNTNSLGSATNAPFTVTASNLTAGSYALTAVATAAGVSTTSAVVNVTVVAPVAVSLSSPRAAGGMFSFNYAANPGLTYVVQNSSNLLTWLPMTTNVAATNPVPFTNVVSNGAWFYRVGRLPNP